MRNHSYPPGAELQARREGLSRSRLAALAALAGIETTSVRRVEREEPNVNGRMYARINRVLTILEAEDHGRLVASIPGDTIR